MKKEIDITAYKCKKCGRIHYPHHDRCLDCKGREFEPLKPVGDVHLLTYTIIYNLPWGFDERYLILGLVEFSNKIRALGQIKTKEINHLKMGMKMHPAWEPVRRQNEEDIFGLVLTPIA